MLTERDHAVVAELDALYAEGKELGWNERKTIAAFIQHWPRIRDLLPDAQSEGVKDAG